MNGPLSMEAAEAALAVYGPVARVRSNRIQVLTGIEKAREAIKTAQSSLSCDHLVQMSTADLGETFELIYHLTGSHRMIDLDQGGHPAHEPGHTLGS